MPGEQFHQILSANVVRFPSFHIDTKQNYIYWQYKSKSAQAETSISLLQELYNLVRTPYQIYLFIDK